MLVPLITRRRILCGECRRATTSVAPASNKHYGHRARGLPELVLGRSCAAKACRGVRDNVLGRRIRERAPLGGLGGPRASAGSRPHDEAGGQAGDVVHRRAFRERKSHGVREGFNFRPVMNVASCSV